MHVCMNGSMYVCPSHDLVWKNVKYVYVCMLCIKSQEDLRDLSEPGAAARQQLTTLDRIHRSYPFMQNTRNIWAGGLLQ